MNIETEETVVDEIVKKPISTVEDEQERERTGKSDAEIDAKEGDGSNKDAATPEKDRKGEVLHENTTPVRYWIIIKKTKTA